MSDQPLSSQGTRIWTLRVCPVCGLSEIVRVGNHRTCAGGFGRLDSADPWHKPTDTVTIRVREVEDA